MLLTKQQKYLLAVLEKLGCAEQRQLAALLQKMFAFSSIGDAMRVTGACVRQMQMGGLLQISDGLITQTGGQLNTQRIEAIDVMLELSAAQPEDTSLEDRQKRFQWEISFVSWKAAWKLRHVREQKATVAARVPISA